MPQKTAKVNGKSAIPKKSSAPSNSVKSTNSKTAKQFQQLDALRKAYPDVTCALNHESPFQLLVATILSAQCTDVMVNKVTPALFKRAPDANTLASIPENELQELIRQTGFFVNKAKHLKGMANSLIERFNGFVPATMDELITLPGVGRKTASVVLGMAFQRSEGIVVDTHVGRLSQRLGWSKSGDPLKIESDLMRWVPQSEWIELSHRLIAHGRTICSARKPLCDDCFLKSLCPRIGIEK